jgi:hypothetical protein
MPSKAFSQAKLLGTDNTISVTSLSTDIPITEKLATVDDLPSTGVIGEQAFVEDTNRLYIWNGSGWYNIALINETPTWDSGGQPAGSYVLDADSPQTSTTITLAASDPEGIPINYTYVTSGQMDSIATISQDSSVFTITPKTEAQAPDGGTGNITFRASDGVNILPQVSSFTLNFITDIENSRYTTLLATATGTSDNNNITDASPNNHTITISGDTHAGTFSPYRSGGYSTYFDHTDRVYLTNDMSVALGTSEFSMEAWIYRTTTDADENVIVNGPSNDYGWGLAISGGKIRARFHNTNLISGATTVSPNEWHHVMIARTSSNELLIFLDGTLDARSTSSSINYNATSATLTIGSYGDRTSAVSFGFNGYIRDARVIVGYNTFPYGSYGTSVGINYFTPPSEPLTAVSGTEALLCGLPYHGDLSSNSHSVSETGGAVTKPFSPYDYDEYSATDHGGSIYFDGTGDKLQTANIISLSGDFTVSAWVYLQGSSKYIIFGSSYPPNYQFFIDASNVIGFYEGSTENGTGEIQRDIWNYCVWTRSGSTVSMYVNGESRGSANSTSTFQIQFVGSLGGQHNLVNGYISDAQVKTTSTSAANAVPPTAPLSSSGAALHIKGTDASIIDKSQGSNLKMFGSTTGSTTQVKFGGSKSMYFDGTGDYLLTSTPALGTGDWTIEGWVYFNSIPTQYIFDFRLGTNTNPALAIASDWIYISDNNQHIQSGVTPSINTWYHFAIVKNSGTTTLYIDGSSIGTFSDSLNYLGNSESTVGNYNTGGNYYLNGYLEDFRVTKGLARYTANFTPPTAPLEG